MADEIRHFLTATTMTLGRCTTALAWILSSAGVSGSDLDQSVIGQMRRAVPALDQVRVIATVQAVPELDLVVTLGGSKEWPPGQNDWLWWDKNRLLGIFLQRRDRTGTVYRIGVQEGPTYCEARIERATATDLVVSCRPEKGHLRGFNYKFVYDIRSKALTGQLAYQPFSILRLFHLGEGAVLVGSDRTSVVALKFDAREGQIPFRLLKPPETEPWTQRVNAVFGLDGFGPGSKRTVDVSMRPFQALHFGSGAQFSLVKNGSSSPNTPASGFKIIERLGKRTKAYELPRTSYDEFARSRPGRVRDGYTRSVAEFEEEIGPSQVADGTLWFAKTFYDGEGATGVGGFGFFDNQTKRYKIYSPREIIAWSATAMLVESEAVWIGLSSHGEYGSTGGGLLRFDRATGTCTKLALPDLIYEIARVGNS